VGEAVLAAVVVREVHVHDAMREDRVGLEQIHAQVPTWWYPG